ncbi:MAG: outer membrane protein transport protein, partial [Boseongicola sp.]
MKRVFLAAALVGASASAVIAGGLDRTGLPIGIIFEDGRYLELSFGGASPSVSGVGGLVTPGALSGDMTESYFQFGAAYKADINDNLSYAIILDQPFGADVAYPTGTGYFAGGSLAELSTVAATGILKYTSDQNFSIYGGLRAQTLKASATVPFVVGYSASTSSDWAPGYVVGAAYEKPEIALRVALTYNSAIEHNLATTESSASPLGGPNSSTTQITTPQSINLDLQTGIAEGTLLFGGVRWVDWSDFDISPADYIVLTGGT